MILFLLEFNMSVISMKLHSIRMESFRHGIFPKFPHLKLQEHFHPLQPFYMIQIWQQLKKKKKVFFS